MRILMAAFATLIGCTSQTRGNVSSSALTFVEDDYPRAVADAKARKVPLFVDAWAPW
jgi:hypothetical protein